MRAIATPTWKAQVANLLPDRLIYLYLRFFPLDVFKIGLARNLRRRDHRHDAPTCFGATLYDLRTCDAIQGRLFMFGIWEPNLTSFLASRLENAQERMFVDVGANIGYFSLLAASTMSSSKMSSSKMPSGKVLALEALPENFSKLQNNLQRNPTAVSVDARSCAASDHSGTLQIYHAGILNTGASTTVSGVMESDPIEVSCERLDNLIDAQWASRIRLIKIDVEGAEYQVIKGMSGLMNHLRADAEVVVELTPERMAEGQVQEIFELFAAHGLHAYVIPNRYMLREYVTPTIDRRFRRLHDISAPLVDVLFTRHDGDYFDY